MEERDAGVWRWTRVLRRPMRRPVMSAPRRVAQAFGGTLGAAPRVETVTGRIPPSVELLASRSSRRVAKYCPALMAAERPQRPAARGPDPVRDRIVQALASEIVDGGYAEVSIASIAKSARISKRTFYEHFRDKEECLVAVFVDSSHRALDEIEAEIEKAESPEQRLASAVRVLLEQIARDPTFAEAMLLDVPAVPGRAALQRRAVVDRMAWLLASAHGAGVSAADHQQGLTPEIAAALCGGVWAIVLRELEGGRHDRLLRLHAPITAFITRVLAGP